MDRRQFIATLSASILLPAFASADTVDYVPGLINERLKAGETVLVDFFAGWCPTCRTQHRVINGLKAENPDYEQKITYIVVNWDAYRGSELTKSLKVSSRSTLVALNPKGEEISRVVADTSRNGIKALLDAALASQSV
ncbi:MAG: thioredoxin family protein [Maritimibacter sp.]